ncbi:tyrosine-type recombinase/integrase [Microbacterium sp. 77mftsu3.1]|uniref:tyrosine-type recombinase/integrase n=1 Tax=Microbacterium sp. 77mftsu3.1 TaxID=1761802 RepID=UPI0003780F9D|nr:tyrosine-type recombinase/integrase [Microbacterium sp. 77mftsu3.1]
MPIDIMEYARRTPGITLLHPEEQMFDEMLLGWRRQQLARNLSINTIDGREKAVRRFMKSTNTYPWLWTLEQVDEFFGDRREIHGNQRTTVRSYQDALKLFTDYICSPAYAWAERCTDLFGTHPVRVIHQWNMARHIQEAEHGGRRRPFRHAELQLFFDRADDEADIIARRGRKGWAAAFRDSTLFKLAYCFGLRRNEIRHLETFDFSRNPHAPEFGKYGHLNVRFGKAMRGSDYKQRNVLAVFPWGSDILAEWIERGLPLFGPQTALFPTERNTLVSESALNDRFRTYRDDLGLGTELKFHSFRHSYITHLIEAGFDPLFVQQQVGHEYASTTALYTGVSSNYRIKTLRDALDGTIGQALKLGVEN